MRPAVLASAALLAAPALAAAQAPADSAADSTRGRKLQRVVVTATAGAPRRGYAAARTRTATRTDTPLRDVPQAVAVVTRDLIADQAMQGMGDVVRYVPGVTMGQGEGHRDAPTIRGNSSTADFFVDGVRDDAQYFRDLYNVERVEALKGPNALVFGRGGGGGVINRVSKEAAWATTRALTFTGGAFDQRRGTLDLGQGFGAVALRLNGMLERSATFRDFGAVRRLGLNPTAAIAAGSRTVVRLGYEQFADDRRVDRGVPSFRGVPSGGDRTAFFGNPDSSYGRMLVRAAGVTVDHDAGRGVAIRNRTRWQRYDKYYQNVFPGAVNAAGTQVSLSAYGNGTDRTNVFNQTDVTAALRTGSVRHTLLAGAEVGRQLTENARRTGYFGGGTATSTLVPFADPTARVAVSFRPSATDADANVDTRVAGVFVQDQVELSSRLQAVLGVRFDRFDLRYAGNRDGQRLTRDDRVLSPRAGLVYKPLEPLSLYGSYGVSFLPSSGDQFVSLTATTRGLEPERFRNRELGAKWELANGVALTGAWYRLDRTNTSAPDPTDASRIVQTGAQRTTGVELGATGQVTAWWQVAGGFAAQRAEIVSTTSAARAGATVPLVPRQTFSLWNRVRVAPVLGAGLGVVQQAKMFAAVDNAVTLPGFTRLDGALFLALGGRARAQLNVENLLDARYYGTSHGNNNIMPGAPRTLRLTLATDL